MTVPEGYEVRRVALPYDCSPTHDSDLDSILHASPDVTIGQFRCDRHHPRFQNTGPISQSIVVFPRTSVWIRHEGSRRFVADPNVVTIYNRGQRYERFPISPVGDHCDWFALSDDFARDAAASLAPHVASADRPFGFERAPASSALYLRQRALQRRAAARQLSALEAEEEVLAIVASVLAAARAEAGTRVPLDHGRPSLRRRDLAEAARAELARTALENRSVSELARTLQTSAFHLCRVFREQTGQTMHSYRVRLRLQYAMEQLDGRTSSIGSNLSAIAHSAGFASHAHFVTICRRELGITPTVLRARLR
ncbi:MAG: helix-turn-helix transcriptional regulator [Gemmatimonadota bacterium]